MALLVLYNPVCGDASARSFFDTHVLPLLDSHNKVVDTLAVTERPGHAGTIVLDFLHQHKAPITVILGSGDGTLQEIVNAVSNSISFVLVPCGTANALYSSFYPASDQDDKLQSLHAFLRGSKTTPIRVARATLSPSVTISAVVVVSAALHASIVHDSESLREEIPGIERFKVAARMNSTRWYKSTVKLSGVVEIYDPSSKRFVPYDVGHVNGPFIYFLSTVNVDRLESRFRITPLASAIPPTTPTLDIVMVRPDRDPSFTEDTPSARSAFEKKMWTVAQGAYRDGVHVDMRYGENGEVSVDGNGQTVVEYVRCGGWEWIPDESDEGAHRVCTDGAISVLEKGGKVTCEASDRHGAFTVYT